MHRNRYYYSISQIGWHCRTLTSISAYGGMFAFTPNVIFSAIDGLAPSPPRIQIRTLLLELYCILKMMSPACVITSGNVTAIPLFHGDQPTYEIALSSSKLKCKRSTDFVLLGFSLIIGSSGTNSHYLFIQSFYCNVKKNLKLRPSLA